MGFHQVDPFECANYMYMGFHQVDPLACANWFYVGFHQVDQFECKLDLRGFSSSEFNCVCKLDHVGLHQVDAFECKLDLRVFIKWIHLNYGFSSSGSI